MGDMSILRRVIDALLVIVTAPFRALRTLFGRGRR